MHRLYSTIIIVFLTSTLLANASASHAESSKFIGILKQQQFLVQQVAEEYLALQKDQKNTKKKQQMQETIQHFNLNHLKLIKNRSNTKRINQKLKKIDQLWKNSLKLAKIKNNSRMTNLSRMINLNVSDIIKEINALHSLYKKLHQ